MLYKVGLDSTVQKNESAIQKQTHICREQMYGYLGGKEGRWEELGDWECLPFLLKNNLLITKVINAHYRKYGKFRSI